MDYGKLKRVFGFTAGLTAGAAAAFYYVTDMMARVAFDRKMPRVAGNAGSLIAGSPKLQQIAEQQKIHAKALIDTNPERITIHAEDGVVLTGHLARCDHPKRLLIAFHGWRSSWAMDFGIVAPFFREQGCNVLYVDQRGQNESGGDYMGFGLLERYDCVAWAKWADAQNFGLPIYLHGISMGATTVLMAGGMDLPDSVHGICADSAFTSPHAIWKHIAQDNLRISYTVRRQKMVDSMVKRKIHLDSNDYSTLEAMKNCRVPVLFVHGTDDKFVPTEMTYENYEACSAPKKMVIVPGAGHGLSYLVDMEGCQKELLDFWQKNDEKKGSDG